MSWSFFNKKKPAAKSNVDRGFEREIAKCNDLERNTKKLYKGMKRCNETFEELSKAELKLAQDISTMPSTEEINGLNHAVELGKTLKTLESHRAELATNVVRTNIEPMKKFYGIFPSVNTGVKKREQCLQEYTRIKGKVEKYRDREKSIQDMNKLELYERDLEIAKNEYEVQNGLMLDGLPQLWEGRVTYFEPCFAALQRSQVDYYSKCCQAYSDLVSTLDGGNVNKNSENIDVEDMLNDIRLLSITANM